MGTPSFSNIQTSKTPAKTSKLILTIIYGPDLSLKFTINFFKLLTHLFLNALKLILNLVTHSHNN